MSESTEKTRLVGIFSMPGEGLVVELGSESGTALYDKQGLQYRIIQRQQAGMDTSTEEIALGQMNNFSPVFDVS
ncbi:MAG: hypothetical protein KTR18_06735 [Acidiferrobacterales bacterium]|nr:hypothetical protein [Acidiferrobacterales bacterium]